MPKLEDPIYTGRDISRSIALSVLDPDPSELGASKRDTPDQSPPKPYSGAGIGNQADDNPTSGPDLDRNAGEHACSRITDLKDGCIQCGAKRYQRVTLDQVDYSEDPSEEEPDQLTLDDIIPDSIKNAHRSSSQVNGDGDDVILKLRCVNCDTTLYQHPLFDSL